MDVNAANKANNANNASNADNANIANMQTPGQHNSGSDHAESGSARTRQRLYFDCFLSHKHAVLQTSLLFPSLDSLDAIAGFATLLLTRDSQSTADRNPCRQLPCA
jgi:hypothetical protein